VRIRAEFVGLSNLGRWTIGGSIVSGESVHRAEQQREKQGEQVHLDSVGRVLMPEVPLLLGIESQRDSGSKPKVARHELPWETVVELPSTPTGLCRRRRDV
jgi:hypothetical protein